MAFLPEFECDVFISYAQLDDKPLRTGQLGWVSSLKVHLEREVGQRLGARSLHIWMDHELAGNKPITSELVAKLRRAATLLVVMSPSYVESEWCKRERHAFLGFARDCVEAGRIFVVRYLDPESGKVPKEFGDLFGYPFWTTDPQTQSQRQLGVLDLEEKYYGQLVRLAEGLATTLKKLKESGEGRRAEAPAVSSPTVFIAHSTDDLGDREEELKGYLEQQGLGVLPRTLYPMNDKAAFQAAMETDLRSCKVFTQLLSGNPGRKVESGADLRYPVLQHEIAARQGGPLLQWRAPSLDLQTVEDIRHRKLLDGARACGFEEFKRAVVEEARRVPPPAREVRANVVAFVDANALDLHLAEEVQNFLDAEGIGSFLPVLSGPADEVRRDLEQNLMECDGLLLVYGTSEPLWVRNQMLQIRKIASQRERPLTALALFIGPPSEKKGELGFKLPNVITLDCRGGVRPEMLQQFVAALRRSTQVTP